MREIIYKYCPFLAGLDAILGVLLLFLLGGFDNGAGWTSISILVSTFFIAGCSWMAWKSLLEFRELADASPVLDNIEKKDDASMEPTTADVPQAGADTEKVSVAIHEVKGFDRLADSGNIAFPMSELTSWLKSCRERGEYPLALPCDGSVFIDARNAGFSNVWVLGDVHGDVKALSAAFSFADAWTHENSADSPVLISLGDLFDRGKMSLETLMKFLGEAKKRPGRVGWLAGNHDFGFHFDELQGCFASKTFPNEFTMWLNAHLEDADVVAFGREVAALCGKLPSAAVIPDDVLLVHGGVPHRDLQERIAKIGDLEDSDMRHDFIWGRLHESLKRKRPSREANCQIGVQDVKDCLSILDNVCGIGCKAILRGHDHFAERVRVFDAYAPVTVVTLNTCSTLKDGAYSAKHLDFTPPAVAHCGNGSLEVFRIAQ